MSGTASSAMRHEISEQPAALAATYRALRGEIERGRTMIAARRHVLFLARGTSDNAATYGRYLLEVVGGRSVASASPAVATLYRTLLELGDTTAVIVSQSGSTEELVDAAAWARHCGAATIAVTNTAGSPLTGVCDLALVTGAGNELAVPATKSHTAQLLTMAMLASDRWDTELAVIGPTIADLLGLLDRSAVLDQATALLAVAHNIVCTGRGFTVASAQETALKLEETTGHACIGLSAADLQHGPIAVLGHDTPLVVFMPPSGPCRSGLDQTSVLAERRGAPTIHIGIGVSANELATPGLRLPGAALPEELCPIGLTIVGQVLAEATATALGFNPDVPHGLTKVTQTAQ